MRLTPQEYFCEKSRLSYNDKDMESEKPHLLVVEDEPQLAKGLEANLRLEGFSIMCAETGEAALELMTTNTFDLIILDIMLPGIDGLEVCRRLRARENDVPILFLTARGSDGDRIMGLQAGADDYLTKPFVVEELILRVRGILRRTAWARTPMRVAPVISIGQCSLDVNQLEAKTLSGTATLTDREVMLVRFFAENDGRVITRGELLERVWGYSSDTATRTLDTFIHRLRKHFEVEPRHPQHFHTVRGVGYRFTTEPEG